MPGPNNHETPGTPLPVLAQPPKSLPPAPKGTTPGSSNEGFSVENMASTWAEKMEIPWDQCSPALKNACRDKQIPDKKELLAFNRVLGDAIHLVQPRPGKRALAIIARRVCSKYPQTFKDFVPGFVFLGDGTTTVLNRLVNYIDSKNRTGANSLRRKLYAAGNEGKHHLLSSKIVMDQCAGRKIICQMEKQKRAKKKDASGLLMNTQGRTRMRGKFTIG